MLVENISQDLQGFRTQLIMLVVIFFLFSQIVCYLLLDCIKTSRHGKRWNLTEYNIRACIYFGIVVT